MTLQILIFRGELYRALTRQTQQLWKLGKEKTLLFTSLKVFVVFGSTKVYWKQRKQNKQISQLHFAPKIIEIHLLVFENELIEDAMLVLKKSKN